MDATSGDIFVVPFFGQGHLFPCMELCKHLSSRQYKTTLIISSNLSSSIPSSLRRHPLIEIAEIAEIAASTPPPPPAAQPGSGPESGSHPFHHRHQQMGQGIESILKARMVNPDPTRPVIAILDVMVSWSKEVFTKFDIPAVSFFTSGACAEAMELAAWKAHADDMKPGESRMLPGLPECMALTYSDVKRRPHGPPHMGGPPGPGGPAARPPGPPGGMKFGPPQPGQRPPWMDEADGSIALLINTCDDLEHPFIDYVANETGKPVWGVGPLLPEQYWSSAGSIIHDSDIRPKRQSNYTEEEVMQWLDSKPRGSVMYVSFGSEVGPTLDEYAQLADALEEWTGPFIWVIQSGSGRAGPPRALFGEKPGSNDPEEGYYPHGLQDKIGNRGLIIQGWAPQLMILSHPSTGGFLSHCGWNSTVEAIGRGVRILAWPIRGDQFNDAKLVMCYLKVGYMVSTGDQMVKKEAILEGIQKLMGDEEVQRRAGALAGKFMGGFPASSAASLDAFGDFISQKHPNP